MLVIWLIAHQGHPPQVVPPAGPWLGAVVPVVVSLIIFDWAPGVAVKIARRRYDRLHGYLSDPEYG